MSETAKNLSHRANALADRILEGAKLLENFSKNLSESEWNKPVLGDGRPIGVVVHHVASSYPVEVQLAQVLAEGNPITKVTKEVVDKMNAQHAMDNAGIDKNMTLELLRINSEKAAQAVREFTDEELDNSAKVSLNFDAPLTAQFFIEDHALRHSFHHLGKIKASL